MKALLEQKFEEAAKLFAHAVEKDGDDYSAQFHLGLPLSLLNRDAEAMAPRKMLTAKPGLFEAPLKPGVLKLA